MLESNRLFENSLYYHFNPYTLQMKDWLSEDSNDSNKRSYALKTFLKLNDEKKMRKIQTIYNIPLYPKYLIKARKLFPK